MSEMPIPMPDRVDAGVVTVGDAADPRLTAERNGVRVGVAAFLMWGFLTVYWKQLGAFAAVELIGWRMLTAAVVMALIVTGRGHWPIIVSALRNPSSVRRLLVAAALLAGNWCSYVWAVVNDRVVETALGYFIAPLATMAIGVLVLGERPDRSQKFAFVSASLAVIVLTVSYGRPPWIALALAVTWSLYALSKRNIGLDAVDGLAGETFVLVVPSLMIVVLLAGRTESVPAAADAVEWVFVLGTGVITAVPLMLFASAARAIPFSLLGPLNLLVPVINFGLGWAIYSEPMPLDRLVGFAFVWLALLVVMGGRIARSRRLGATMAT